MLIDPTPTASPVVPPVTIAGDGLPEWAEWLFGISSVGASIAAGLGIWFAIVSLNEARSAKLQIAEERKISFELSVLDDLYGGLVDANVSGKQMIYRLRLLPIDEFPVARAHFNVAGTTQEEKDRLADIRAEASRRGVRDPERFVRRRIGKEIEEAVERRLSHGLRESTDQARDWAGSREDSDDES